MIAHGKDIKIFSGNANKPLAEAICKKLGITLGNAEVGCFSDGESYASIYETVRGSDVFLVQSTCSPVNAHLMEAAHHDRRHEAGLRLADHRRDPLIRLRPPGPQGQAP